MARVEMLHHIAGGRGDGTEWPYAGGVLVCGVAEARDLVRGGNAKWADEEVPPPATEPPAEPSAAAVPDVELSEPEEGPDGDTDAAAPRVRDPKETWEMHAMTVHGIDVNVARSMTKKELIDQFGGSV